jgi:hypothetical protein
MEFRGQWNVRCAFTVSETAESGLPGWRADTPVPVETREPQFCRTCATVARDERVHRTLAR